MSMSVVVNEKFAFLLSKVLPIRSAQRLIYYVLYYVYRGICVYIDKCIFL